MAEMVKHIFVTKMPTEMRPGFIHIQLKKIPVYFSKCTCSQRANKSEKTSKKCLPCSISCCFIDVVIVDKYLINDLVLNIKDHSLSSNCSLVFQDFLQKIW
ncbi:hypothetical protein AMECASPLE_001435 [Ameca splendens]|uniref:Uncharacterized protein n=1 Tax=Ameca splendens TaxID=208324 RepID=A0ABV1A6W7_9TELE